MVAGPCLGLKRKPVPKAQTGREKSQSWKATARGETPRRTLSKQTQKGPNPARDGLCLLSKKSCSSGG